ncbi:quinone oxidoreductase family protein [Pedosphaera parvula]|uniref:Alcohol dehydrogenase zinc-binding domain protein n=1 Tax=Pedosphaera parvula (strain Ellin514) TaxID=320771 RepID=B9XE09_PEDPL|nr:NADPH:quinone oxidoreductase family protein [Pedosphaera parvula]EEF61900.1 Alcohol dehydrogenase zinc-binding domain protein [Pedosphaera parvula Ellin514]
MKTAQVIGFGGVDRIQIIDVPAPKPGIGEVLIRIKACGLNGSDILQREGIYPGGPKPPFFPGSEAAGIVEMHGSGVNGPPIGTAVTFLTSGGAHAEFATVKADSCIPLPETLTFVEGAAFPVHYLTAYHALTTVAHAKPGETVVIHAAAGGLGTAAVQIARILGLKILATASTPEKRRRVVELGADLAVDYSDFESACRDLTGGNGPALILDSIGGDIFRRSLALLPPLGRLVVMSISSNETPKIDAASLLFRSKSVSGIHLSALLTQRELIRRSLEELMNWIGAGKIRIQVGHTLPLASLREAHTLLASRKSYGKIVLTT